MYSNRDNKMVRYGQYGADHLCHEHIQVLFSTNKFTYITKILRVHVEKKRFLFTTLVHIRCTNVSVVVV